LNTLIIDFFLFFLDSFAVGAIVMKDEFLNTGQISIITMLIFGQ